jgi:hypothetical protein
VVLPTRRGPSKALSYRLSSLILGPLDHRHGSPDHELAAVMRDGSSNVVELRPQPKPPAVRRAGTQGQVFQLKVTLLGIKPPVWRRILVHPSTPLDRLHEYIQAAFGWWNYHLYEFEIDRVRYGIPDPDWDFGPPTKNAHRTKLGNVADVGDSFEYTYDFGDGWDHKITIEKSIPIAPEMTVPACTDGRRACPPEDCGGTWGYEEFLRILADPSHPEHEERVMWARSVSPSMTCHSPWNANSFITPTVLRSFVFATRTSPIAASSAAMNASLAPWLRSAVAIACGTRETSVAAGASGMNTGSSVRWFTSSATCGFQNSAVANQSPSTVVDTSSGFAAGPFTRSRSFFVPRSTSIRRVSNGPQLRPGSMRWGRPRFYRIFYRTGRNRAIWISTVQHDESRSTSSSGTDRTSANVSGHGPSEFKSSLAHSDSPTQGLLMTDHAPVSYGG